MTEHRSPRLVGEAEVQADCLTLIPVCPSAAPGLSFSPINKQRDNVVGQTVLAAGPAGPIVRGAAPLQRAPLCSQDLPVLQR